MLSFFLSFFYLKADTKIVEGEMLYRFKLSSTDNAILDGFHEYENASNSQKVIERGKGFIVVENRTDLSPFKSTIPFPIGERYRKDFIEELDLSTSVTMIRTTRIGTKTTKEEIIEKTPMTQREIDYLTNLAKHYTEGAKTQHEAVERVVRGIRSKVTYRLGTSSNPADVMRSGKAYCEGYANAGLLLLRILGIPARVVDCYIPPGHMWGFGQQGSGGFHAYIDVYYDDAGWVSYDPQASIHFVDPFHIADYPRSGVRLTELNEKNNMRLVDAKEPPANWDNFFMRSVGGGQITPLFVGTITGRNGEMIRDSFKTNQWIFRRKDDGSGEGIRIFPTGEFGVAVPSGNEKTHLFFTDAHGGWIDTIAEARPTGRTAVSFDLSRNDRVITLNTGKGRRTVYNWYTDANGKWLLQDLKTDSNGNLYIAGDGGDLHLSLTRNINDRRHTLSRKKHASGSRISLADLPAAIDPSLFYVKGKIAQPVPEGIEIKASNSAWRHYAPETVGINGEFLLSIPSASYNRIILSGKGFFTIKTVKLQQGKSVLLPLPANSGVNVKTGKPNSRYYIMQKKGNGFAIIGQVLSDSIGEIRIDIENSMEGEWFYNASRSANGLQPIR